MDAVPIFVALGGILVGVVALALLRRERARIRAEARDRARRDDQLRRERAAADDARESADLVLASMEDGVLLFGPGGGTRLANPSVEAQLGARPALGSGGAPAPGPGRPRPRAPPRPGRRPGAR